MAEQVAAPGQANPPPEPQVPPPQQDIRDRVAGYISVAYLLTVAIAGVYLLVGGWPMATDNKVTICKALSSFVSELPSIKKNVSGAQEILSEIADACSREVHKVFGLFSHYRLTQEQVLLLIVAAAGAIGGAAYGLRSSVWHLGVRRFSSDWLPWYFVQPFLGAALGVVTYFVVRAGFINPNSTEALNAFGFVAIAGLVGLFTENAFAHLRKVADSVLREAQRAEQDKASGERKT